MNRHLLAAATLALLPAVASAQPTAPVQMTVMSEVHLTRSGITDFGPVGTHGEIYTIDPANPTGAQQTARFTASGAAGATVVVSWASTLDLCHETAGCGTRLVFTPNLSQSECGICQPFSSAINSGGSAQLNGDGTRFFWLGGNVTVNASQAPGVYSGIFTLVAAYQ